MNSAPTKTSVFVGQDRANSPGATVDLVILAGTVGAGDALISGPSRPFLPLPGTTIVEALLKELREAFSDGTCTICANSHTGLFASRLAREVSRPPQVEFLQDRIPYGTAGCVKACESRFRGDVVFIAGASVWLEDDPLWMVEQHRLQGNALTVFCAPGSALNGVGRDRYLKPVGLYCCDPSVLDLIPERGYLDLKEQLVPSLRRAGCKVGAVAVRNETREVSDWPTYLHAVARALSGSRLQGSEYNQLAPEIWYGRDVTIAPHGRIVGPAFLGHGCTIADDAIVIGPAIIGDGCHIGRGARLLRVVVPGGARIPAEATVADQLLLPGAACMEGDGTATPVPATPEPLRSIPEPTGTPNQVNPVRPTGMFHGALVKTCAGVAGLAALFVWAFWHSFEDLWRVWQNNPDYSAGQLVPLAAAYMVVLKRHRLAGLSLTFERLGLVVFALGVFANLLGNYYLFSSLQNLGLVVCANGLVMMLLGRRGYQRVWFPLVFLLLMIPLPGRIHDAVMLPLQGFCAMVSATMLEIMGVPVERLGHILHLRGHQVAVAEACNGLRMALAFLMVAGVVAYVVQRPVWQKVTVVLSSLPIAIICNVIRIVMVARLYGTDLEWLARGTMHDVAGLFMMPAALCLMLLELRLLSTLAPPGSGRRAGANAIGAFGRTASTGAIA